ncbi:hypothetical protein FE257_007443 [Aspergillus nanangensis]|uniref:Uncharacterized protein n=1 Tax=Aspergillus nanangensis TaxID=2582783 RepID=A0AAD4GVC9_ASPNN|nr:hypothetical protein FE257_007443 [Aspergillus nanangensis]
MACPGCLIPGPSNNYAAAPCTHYNTEMLVEGALPRRGHRAFLRFHRTWPYWLIAASLSLLFIENIALTSSLTNVLLTHRLVLRPGDFVDSTRQKTYPDAQGGPSFYAAEFTGVSHDERDENFYLGGTLTLTAQDPNASHPSPIIYDPYPEYNSWIWRTKWEGRFESCLGPRDTYLDRTRPEDMVLAYPGLQKGREISFVVFILNSASRPAEFPFPIFGSYDALGLDGHVCFDRYGRLGAYGYGEGEYDEDIPGVQLPGNASWGEVDWADLQSQCLKRNANRYRKTQTRRRATQHPLVNPLSGSEPEPSGVNLAPSPSLSWKRHQSRSAVIIRTYHSMSWTDNHIHYLRSLIMELSLHSGAEYEVFFMVDVKDDMLPIFSDMEAIQSLKEEYIPAEFQNITIFFNNKLLEAWYPRLGEHRPMYQHLQPLQIFAQLYPEFDYYWQFEMDARNTGHMYHFLERAVEFARQQPRRYLWERNAYFYTPGSHGTWDDFMELVNTTMAGRDSVWGPVPATDIDAMGPPPPVPEPEDDPYEWRVGEEVDLITFLPIFDPKETSWTFPNTLYNLPPETPRRASPVTMWRMSKTLLDLMHHSQASAGVGLASEMSAPTWALWHGLKAVHVPHPVYLDGKWTADEVAQIYNTGQPDKINGGPHSVWNFNHMVDRIMYRLSYMFTTQTAEDLYRRWLGFRPSPGQYEDAEKHRDHWGLLWYEGGRLDEDVYGRLCFPSMFLHTIKNTAPEMGPDPAVPI